MRADVSPEERQSVEQALAAGRLTVVDPATGYHRSMYAACPRDGSAAAVWRIARGAGGAVIELTMHCSQCGHEFKAAREAIFLR